MLKKFLQLTNKQSVFSLKINENKAYIELTYDKEIKEDICNY